MLNLKNWQFYLLLGFVIIYTASLVPAFKITLQEVSAEQITFFNYLIPAIFFLIIFAVRKNLYLIKEHKSQIHYFIPIAFVGFFLSRILYLNSFHFIQATEANILYYTYPLSVAVLGFVILKEKISKSDIAGLALGFIGAFVVITRLELNLFQVDFFGDLLAILGGAAYGAYLIYGKKLKINTMVLLFYTALFAAIMAGIYVLLFHEFTVPSMTGWAGLLYIGIAEGILVFLFIELLRRKSTFKIANSFYAIPFVVAILNYFILGEIIYLSYIIGLVLLVAGILIQNRGRWGK